MKMQFLELAQHELEDAVVWYDNQAIGLGLEFLDEVDVVIRRISTWPYSGAEFADGVYRCLMRRFPYQIVYGIDSGSIVIIAVAHLHRAPRYWIDRL
jgi:toxin ParE2